MTSAQLVYTLYELQYTANLASLQEAKFEIISSEASYLKSLNVLVAHFANSGKLRHNPQVISRHDWDAIFSNVYQVKVQIIKL